MPSKKIASTVPTGPDGVTRKPKSPPIRQVGVVGLGIMGSAMASNLMQAGFEVFGFDPGAQARKRFRNAAGQLCKDLGAMVPSVQVLICSLPTSEALLATAQQLAALAPRGMLVIETSTLDIDDKQQARKLLASAGIVLLDCPLSGTGAQALLKDVTVYASGPKSAIQRLAPVFQGFAKSHFDLGAFGNGMRMKLMANMLVAVHNVAAAEALLLGQRWGISPKEAVRVLSDGAGGSRMLQVRGPQMENRGWEHATMKIQVWQKDMKLIGAALRDAGVPAPLFAATVPLYDAAAGMGHAQHDTAAVFDVLDRMSRPPAASQQRG